MASDADAVVMVCMATLSILIFAMYIAASIKKVNPWENGVKIMGGKVESVLQPGYYFVPVVFGNVIKVDMRVKSYEVQVSGMSRDGVRVTVKTRMGLKVSDPLKYVVNGGNREENVMHSIIAAVKRELSNHDSTEIRTMWGILADRLRSAANMGANEFGVTVTTVDILKVVPQGNVWKNAKGGV